MIRVKTDKIARAVFFRRVLLLIANEALSDTLRRAGRDPARAKALWTPLWHEVRAAPEPEAALRLVFLLACDAEGMDSQEAARRVAMSADPLRGMKRFLAERCHLGGSELALPHWLF